MACFILKPILWNVFGYRRPSGVRALSGFPRDNGFGHEEWNNSPHLHIRDSGGEFRVFHTEGVGSAPVAENSGQTFVFMTASHDGIQQLVGVGGNATALFKRLETREHLSRQLHLERLWEDAWAIPRVRARFKSDDSFRRFWNEPVNGVAWIPVWICPADFFWWLETPVTLQAKAITGKQNLLRMFGSYTLLDRAAALRILEMVPKTQQEPWRHRLIEAVHTAPEIPVAEDISEAGNASLTTQLSLINARRGQGKFRQDLKKAWNDACAVTGTNVPELLRASHIKPWKDCSNQSRLEPENGLLLTANLDALFDAGLITFEDNGQMRVSKQISMAQRASLGLPARLRHKPSPKMQEFLRHHRDRFKK